MKIKFLIPVLTFLAVLAAQAWATAEVAKMTTTVVSASPSRTVMRMEIPADAIDHNLSTVQFGGHVYDGFGEFIAIAGHGTPTARVLSVNTGAVVNTFGIPENDIAQSPDELVMVGTPIIVHDLRVVTVNAMPLLRGSDGVVRIVSSFEVEITTSGVGENEKPEPTSLSYAFAPVYRHLVRNLDEAFPELAVRAPGRFLIIGRTRMIESELAGVTVWSDYLDLKRRKGYQVQVASFRTIYQAVGDTSQNGVRQFISQTYHDPSLPSLDYALIIGDGEESGEYVIPAWFFHNPENANENSYGDNDYFTIDGTDYVSDVLHGRIPAQSTPEVVRYLAKVNRYETDPYRDNPQWFHSVTCVAGNYTDGTSPTYPVTPVWNMRWAREWLLRSGCITDADTFFFHDPSEVPGDLTEDITIDINTGVSAVFYRGWADDQIWQRPVWGNPQLPDLHLENRNPAFFSIVCGAGRYVLGTSTRCVGEMLTVGIGSTTESNGAIVFYGASDFHTNTRHNNSILSGITEALLIDGMRSSGGLTFSGELEATRQFPRELDATGPNSYVRYYIWHAMNILGDPEVPLVICEPTEFTLYAPTQLAVGETVVPVGVAAPGQPTVENAVVTIRSEGQQNFSTERTNQGGVAWVPVQFTEAGMAQITVWKGRHFLKTVTIPIVSLAYDPQISSHGFGAGDDYLPNPGETITLSFGVRNRGTSATAYTITATSPDPRLTIISGTATVENVPPGEERLSTSLALTLPQDTYDGQEIVLNLNFSNGVDQTNRTFMLPVYAADPLITQLTINDGNNGILEPNEGTDITVTVRNEGGVRAPSLAAEVSSWDNAVSFSDASITWPVLEVGQESVSSTTFHAQIANGVTRGRQIQLRFVFTDNDGQIMARKTAVLTVGVLNATVPTGPDEYGYYAYENVDAGFAKTPTLNWIELDPARGGSGAEAHQVRDDTHFGMRLPAPFTYYGQNYDSVWICSNGWISFENATMPEFRNWEIPSPIGPPSMVCPFWDDLIGASNSDSSINVRYNVWTRHDPGQNRFIVQWRNWNRRGHSESPGIPNADSCSFEVVLEYNASGDGDILFQYAAIANTDGTNNFASVGIQDSWHQRGLGLTYSGYRPVTVDTLVAGRVIRFSTTPPDNFLGSEEAPTVSPKQFALHEAYPNPFNPATELRFELTQAGPVSLKIFDLLGREAATLVDETRSAGSYTVRFDASGLTTGLYFARLTSGSHTAVRKIMLIK